MKWFFILLALAAGATMPMQAGVNLRLKQALGDPIFAALVSFGVGTLALAVYAFVLRPVPTVSMAATAPWWSWLGGLFGAFFVSVIIILAAQLGATASMAWLLAGQFLAALILDHFGLISFAVRDVSLPRLAGVALVILGAFLVNKY